jgi:hypothetical protein
MTSKNTFNDAGDGTCMDCGRSRANCYCSIPFDDDNEIKLASASLQYLGKMLFTVVSESQFASNAVK